MVKNISLTIHFQILVVAIKNKKICSESCLLACKKLSKNNSKLTRYFICLSEKLN